METPSIKNEEIKSKKKNDNFDIKKSQFIKLLLMEYLKVCENRVSEDMKREKDENLSKIMEQLRV